MKLYDIDKALEEALDAAIDPETGEILDDSALADVEALQLAREEKIEGVALWVKNMEAEADAVKAEKDNFAKRERTLRNKINAVKTHYLAPALDGERFKTPRVAISYRTSEAVEIDDTVSAYELMALNVDFVKLPEPEVNKTAIKAALKSGREIKGVHLVRRLNLQIK